MTIWPSTSICAVVLALSALLPASAVALDDTMGTLECSVVPGAVGMFGPALEGDISDIPFGNGWDPLFAKDTDNGVISMIGQAACTGGDVAANRGQNNQPSAFAGTYDFNASGIFSNLVCGKMTANGTFTLSGPSSTSIGGSFGFALAGWQGDIGLLFSSGAISGPSDSTGNAVGGGLGTGSIQLVPENSCHPDVREFNWQGSFTAIISDADGGYQ
jgi:hypothetical protein